MARPRLALVALLGVALAAVAAAHSAPPFLRDAPPVPYGSKAEGDEDENYRLNLKGITPVKYDITLTPEFPTDGPDTDIRTFNGKVIITIDITEDDIQEIRLHAAENIVIPETGITVTKDGEEGGTARADGQAALADEKIDVTVDAETLRKKYEIVILEFENTLAKGTYKITIMYEGNFLGETDPKYMAGFYKSTYTIEGSTEKRLMLTTQFESTSARMAFPCFDEPQYKATFTVTFVVPDKYGVIGNTKVENNAFSVNMQMSTYLLAFIVYETNSYSSVEDTVSQRIYRTWGRKDDIEAGDGALSQLVSPKIIKALEDYTKQVYPINELDQAAIPDFSAGAMENWGLVTYRESALMFSEKNTEAARRRVVDVIAHELAHQWFGNLVTTEWWGSIWLNEGFATYFSYYITDEVYPDWREMERLVVEDQFPAFAADSTGTSRPLTDDSINTPSQISGHFSTISYSKGGSILRMFSNVMGAENFQTAIQEYLDARKYKPAIPDNLLDALIHHLPNGGLNEEEFRKFFASWTTKPGYPVINVEGPAAGKVKISQKRFLLDNSESTVKYYIPLQIQKDGKDPEAIVWLKDDENSKDFELEESSWLLINNIGYFRVNYTEENWGHLAENFEKLEDLQKASLLHDALNLARANQLNYDTAFKLVRQLKDESDYIPWSAAFYDLAFLYRMLAQTEEATDFDKFVLEIVDNVYKEVGFTEDEDEEGKNWRAAHRTSVLTWACRSGHEDCIKTAKEKLEAYVEKGDAIDANLKSVVYCYGIKHGDEELWNALWYQLTLTNDAAEASLLINALGCTDHVSTLLMYLEQSVANVYIRSQDASSVFTAVYTNPKGVDTALDFLTKHTSEIVKVYGSTSGLRNSILGIGNYIYTEEQLKKLEKLGEASYDEPLHTTVHEALATAKSSAQANIKWQEETKDEVIDSIKDDDDGGDGDGDGDGDGGDGGGGGGGAWMGQPTVILLVLSLAAGVTLR